MFKGKQIKFLEQETTKLGVKSEEHDKEIQNVKTKLDDLEKLMNSTKESLNELSASRFDSISNEIKEFNEKVENSMHSLENLQKDMGELSLVNQSIVEIKKSIDGLKVDFKDTKQSVETLINNNDDNKSSIIELQLDIKGSKSSVDSALSELQSFRVDSKNEMAALLTEFNETKEVVQKVKNDLQEERQKVIDGQETIMKQEVTINEKTTQLDKLEKELRDSRAQIGKLEAQNDSLEKELSTLKESRDKQYKDLTAVQEEFTDYKKKNEGEFAFNAAIKRLLEQSTEGKIMLELFKKSPQSIDAIADKISVASVIIKTAINNLQDINAIKVDSETRMVSL